ncbi:MAG: DKNYY domain-containing protein [Panacibacter sp.]
MKRILMFAILTAVIKFFTGCTGSSMFFKQGYNISGNKVYYKKAFPNGTMEVEGADIKSFKPVMQPGMSESESATYFATDKHRVYYSGYALAGSDGNSFSIISGNYSRDKNQCYYRGTIIQNADPASFTVKNEIFAADKNNIYQREILMDRNASLFETFDSSTVVHTANAVSVFGTIIPLLPGATFRFLKYNYYAVNGQVYFQDKPIPEAGADDFKALDNFFSATGKHVYYSTQIIKNANPATYQILPSPYSKDDKHIFFFEKTIEGADVNSFEILNIKFQCSRDKHWAYHEDKRIKNVTVEDMANKKPCRQCNKEAIYFGEN